VSDSDSREALLGTWRPISGYPRLGDNPQGYLVYTTDGHVFVQIAARERPELFGPSEKGPALLETAQANSAIGLECYCGTFEVRDGQAIHHLEFGLRPRWSGSVLPRSVTLDGDRLILDTPRNAHLEWQRVDARDEGVPR
jgi:hypothetical protein